MTGSPRRSALPLLLALAASLAPGVARAQDAQALRAKYMIEVPQWLRWYEAAMRSAPGASASSPAAFGASFGDVFVGAGYQQTVRMADKDDGAVLAGFGLGNPATAVGLEVAVTSLSTLREPLGNRVSASFKLHRSLPGMAAVAVGVENGVMHGGTDGGRSWYGVASKLFPLTPDAGRAFSSISVSAGVGDGRFRSFPAVRDDRKTVGVFGSVGVRVLPAATAIADWTGQDLALALSIAPFPRFPLVITPGLADVTGQAGGNAARFGLGVGGGVHLDF